MTASLITRSTGGLAAASVADVVDFVSSAYASAEAVRLRGGGTALDYGYVKSREGRTLELGGLSRIVDYTPRDMTIVVEAGVRMSELAVKLASEGQCLPIDVPRASEATIGGVVATNWCGPRRYGHGTVRDYVIGIHAVDGRGVLFKAGGRVVKNVAGYDFCKLLAGSLGTLGVITELVLKVKPLAERRATVVAECDTWEVADEVVARLVRLDAPAAAIDLMQGKDWYGSGGAPCGVAVELEGTDEEVRWLVERSTGEIAAAGGSIAHRLPEDEARALWQRRVEFSDRGAAGTQGDDESELVVQIFVPPSAVTRLMASLMAHDIGVVALAHAASGVVIARYSKFAESDVSAKLLGDLRPLATALGGSVVVVRSKVAGLTPYLVWGGRTDAMVLLERIKQKFDPKGILNPGCFVFH